MSARNNKARLYFILAAFLLSSGAAVFFFISGSPRSRGAAGGGTNGRGAGTNLSKIGTPTSLDIVAAELKHGDAQGGRLFHGGSGPGSASARAADASGDLKTAGLGAAGRSGYSAGADERDGEDARKDGGDAAKGEDAQRSDGKGGNAASLERIASRGAGAGGSPGATGGAQAFGAGGEGGSAPGAMADEAARGFGNLSVTRDDGSEGTLRGTFFADPPERMIPQGVKAIATVLKTRNAGGGAKTVYFSDDSVITFPPGSVGSRLNACDQAVFKAVPVEKGMKPPPGKGLTVTAAASSKQGSLITFSDGSQISYTSKMSGSTLKEGQAVVQAPEPYGKFVTVVSNKPKTKDLNEVTFSDGTKISYADDEFGYRYRQNDHAILMPPKSEEEAEYYPGVKRVAVAKTLKDGDGNRVTFSDGTQMYYTSVEEGYGYAQGQTAKLYADPHCKVVAVKKAQMTEGGNLVTFSDGSQIHYAPGRIGYAYKPGDNVVLDRNGHQVPIEEGGHHHPEMASGGHSH